VKLLSFTFLPITRLPSCATDASFNSHETPPIAISTGRACDCAFRTSNIAEWRPQWALQSCRATHSGCSSSHHSLTPWATSRSDAFESLLSQRLRYGNSARKPRESMRSTMESRSSAQAPASFSVTQSNTPQATCDQEGTRRSGI
jgi:hypothetical protein